MKKSEIKAEQTEASDESTNESRRNFLKLGAAGAGLAAAAAGGITVVKRMGGLPLDHFPLPINNEYERIDQRNQINTYSFSKKLNDAHPERTKKFFDWNFYEKKKGFFIGPYRDKAAGQGQLDRALGNAGFFSPVSQLGYKSTGMDSLNSGVASWEQTMLAENKYKFDNPEQATLCIKSAARLFGAVRCGITPRDERWDYDPLFDADSDEVLTWEKDFPFKPRSVIVVMVDMDYDAIATAPAWTTDGATGEGYGRAIKLAGQMAVFMRQLGYQAVASMNDLGMNVPYAVAAGLGEAARNGAVITPHFGPRVRVAKIYTDFDFVEYARPRDFGVASFCKNCKRCADSCPSKAITFGDPSWGPEYSTDPDYIWQASKGVFKFHNDSKLCFKFWIENDGSCAACIASCPYNKPDFWHHRLVDAQNVIAPGPVHSFMREMDILFGYGKVSDPERVIKFWKSGAKI